MATSAGPLQAHFLFVRWFGETHGIYGTGLPLFNLSKKKKTIQNSFRAPIEREHDLFFTSSDFDIYYYILKQICNLTLCIV
jgi:hypothetical protein